MNPYEWGGPFHYFTDAVLRAPTLGSILMCLASALVGVIVFLRRQSLIGEALSHAAYPGVILGVIIAGVLSIEDHQEWQIAILIMSGAFFSSLLGLWAIHYLEQKVKVHSDSALCFILSAFFGIGLTLASQVQFSYTSLYRQVQVYLYGQAATMTDRHIVIYAILCLIVIVMIMLFYKELQAMIFDKSFAKSIGIQTRSIDTLVFILVVLAVVIGMRSVGVVLMSAMLVAPAAAARQYTNKFSRMFPIAALFGTLSGFLGNYFSSEISRYLNWKNPAAPLGLPTGPMIVMIASLLCLLSLLFAPEKGMILRFFRLARFRYKCLCENLLKAIWRFGGKEPVTFELIEKYQTISPLYLRFILWRLTKNGWIEKILPDSYRLTLDGKVWANKIVRLHRLWEVYLVEYLGLGVERVHRSAEEMEHIITPELEKELTLLLKDPKVDPHHQPIPPREK